MKASGTEAAPAADPVVELCAFRVGDEEYVVDLRRVREVVPPLPVRPVPRAPDAIEGVVDLRGEVIPVVDVRRRFGIPDAPRTRTARLLVIRIEGRVQALLVDAVLEVMRIPRSAIRPAPVLPGSGGPRLFLGACRGSGPGAARSGAKLRLLLNVRALTRPIEPEALEAARALAAGEGKP
ncbi:MAG TPA: chemotaxis protein CheW [Anaeromyxobacteraceae bacterium]|nr:chemotaxis protein CheW [Anaeromyxobacteraceae bacterium]